MDSLEAAPAVEVASGADRKISLLSLVSLSLSLSQPLLPFKSVIMWMISVVYFQAIARSTISPP